MVVKITEAEKNEIQEIFSKKQSLAELLSVCKDDNDFTRGLKEEFMEVSKEFRDWFMSFERNYKAVSKPDYFWNVNFFTNEVVLTKISSQKLISEGENNG